jgi:capsular exopolysaccharide synthesis family protein
MEEEAAPAAGFPVKKLLLCLLKLWWVPIVTLVLGLVAAAVVVLLQERTYVSKASMLETVKMHLPEGSLFSEDNQNSIATMTELLQSPSKRKMAQERLQAAKIPVPKDKKGEPLRIGIRVTQPSKGSVYILDATGSKAAYTQAYLDELMNVYLDFKRDTRNQISQGTLSQITATVKRANEDLKKEQDKLLEFQRTNNLVTLQQEGAINGGYLAGLKTKLSDLQLESRLLQAGSADSFQPGATDRGTNASVDWVASVAGTSAGSAAATTGQNERHSAARELELLQLQRDRLSKHLKPKHPKIVKLDADIQRAEKLIELYQRQSQEQLTASREAVQLKINNVTNAIAEWNDKVVEANDKLAELEGLKLNVSRAQSFYDRLDVLVETVSLGRNIDTETMTVLDHASLARRTYTKELSQLALGGLGGLGLGLGLIVLIAVRDDRLLSLGEVNQKLGQVIVGQVPAVENRTPEAPLALVEFNDRRHAYAESFRSLRSALMFMSKESERPKVILITSALPNEGKSTVAANLARTLALGGSRVLLVDGDLRKGVLHKLIGLPSEPGLADALRQPAELEKMIQTNCMAHLSVLARGNPVGHSGDLLLGSNFDKVLVRMRELFDFVLIDSSPVFAADDATTLAPKVDGTLFVVRSRVSRAGPAREALEQLYQRNARVLGVIFNQADSSARSYYYYKYSEYYGPEATA